MARRTKQGKKSRRQRAATRWMSISAIVTLLAMLALPIGTAAESASTSAVVLYTCVTVTPTVQVSLVGENAQLDATVTENLQSDCSGASIPVSVPVAFDVTGTNTLTSNTTSTVDGHATYTYSSASEGSDQVTASAGGVTSDPVTVDWITTAPTNLDLSPTSVNAAVGTDQTWTTTVTDTVGDPIEGVPVYYEVAGANAQGPTSAGMTDANGEATFHYTGSTAGDDTVTAFTDLNGNEQLDTGELSKTAAAHWAAPATVTLDPTILTMATGTSLAITATVNDGNGDPLQGVVVHFSITGANPGSGDVTTDANGEATFTDSGTNAGIDTVHATVTGISDPAAATIQWIEGPAELLSAHPIPRLTPTPK